MFMTNVVGTIRCIQGVAPVMINQKSGTIITVSSTIARHPANGTGGYAATKGGVENITTVAANELGRFGVRVNCLAAGFFNGGLSRDLIQNEKAYQQYLKRFALGRPGHLDEIGGPAAFLASDDASYVNGAVLAVDGGMRWPA
jgi:NAD(P)-dependent dehydrogenase (short-subunit alcohol dehydrogenase family)